MPSKKTKKTMSSTEQMTHYVTYKIPRFVIPNAHEWKRDFFGIPYMFCRTLPMATRQVTPIDEPSNELHAFSPEEIAREQAREFGEEFLPAIYEAMSWWLGNKKTKELFIGASKTCSRRTREVSSPNRDTYYVAVYKSFIDEGDDHSAAIKKSVNVIMKNCKYAQRTSAKSARKHLDRVVNRFLRDEIKLQKFFCAVADKS